MPASTRTSKRCEYAGWSSTRISGTYTCKAPRWRSRRKPLHRPQEKHLSARSDALSTNSSRLRRACKNRMWNTRLRSIFRALRRRIIPIYRGARGTRRHTTVRSSSWSRRTRATRTNLSSCTGAKRRAWTPTTIAMPSKLINRLFHLSSLAGLARIGDCWGATIQRQPIKAESDGFASRSQTWLRPTRLSELESMIL